MQARIDTMQKWCSYCDYRLSPALVNYIVTFHWQLEALSVKNKFQNQKQLEKYILGK